MLNFYSKEVPRMLLSANEIEKLKNFIDGEDNKKLYKWWSQYCES